MHVYIVLAIISQVPIVIVVAAIIRLKQQQ